MTTVPDAKVALQAARQLMPAGDEVTDPEPIAPFRATFRAYVPTATGVKVAVTKRAPDIVTTQVLVPLHAPLQPANWNSADGDAARVTVAPFLNEPVQLATQSMPVGDEPTRPDPATVRESV